jgi:pyridoxine 5-phosphate synthase
MTHQRLYINIDHIATVRQARRGDEPVPAHAVGICERAGADGITAHLREDRRHIQDADIQGIAAAVTTVFNLEIACTAEMLALAERLRPHQATLVPERREEVTTEGGLALEPASAALSRAIERLRTAGIRSSLFIDPDRDSVTRSRDLGADAVELHTGRYAHAPGAGPALDALRDAASLGASLGLAVHAGHGLTTGNVGPVAAIPEIEELNIGHHVVSRAIFVGLDAAVRELRAAMDAARHRV